MESSSGSDANVQSQSNNRVANYDESYTSRNQSPSNESSIKADSAQKEKKKLTDSYKEVTKVISPEK